MKDRRGAVLDDRAKMQEDSLWIYNDWQRGFAEAKKSGKPLLVVLRCVPCLACAGIDASVLTEDELQPLLQQFVCVRLINANTIDLSLFQFDYDLSFSSMFFNGDGTVYGRYGSWSHQKDSQDRTIAGYKNALQSALAIHKGYPANKAALQGKQGKPMPVKDPLQLPELAGKYKRDLDWDGKVVQSCVHCHQVSDAVRSMYRAEKKIIPQQLVYPMPLPETLGVTLDSEGMRVGKVVSGSIGAKSGLKPGDELVTFENQPLISTADISWVLHHAPDEGNLVATAARDGKEIPVQLSLPRGWRAQSDISRRVGTWPMRAMATGGMLLKDLSDEDRAKRGLTTGQLALRAEHVGEYGNHAAAKKAGFKKEDVLVSVDGITGRITESQLIGRLLETKAPGEQVKATVLRGNEKLELKFPIQ
ncbi:MAG: Trx7/PDZ domain-containing (seleno)protein [Limisphaerales bacterium]